MGDDVVRTLSTRECVEVLLVLLVRGQESTGRVFATLPRMPCHHAKSPEIQGLGRSRRSGRFRVECGRHERGRIPESGFLLGVLIQLDPPRGSLSDPT